MNASLLFSLGIPAGQTLHRQGIFHGVARACGGAATARRWWHGNKNGGVIHRLAALLLLILVNPASAQGDLVELGARLDPAQGAVPGQRIKLEVTVATPRWFTAGTRIKLPEVPGLILLQNQDFAANATERRGGESWTVQRWSLDVFVTRPGSITIPPLQVSVAVSRSPTETYKATLATQPLIVTTEIPPALREVESWVASPSVSLHQTIDGTLDTYPGAAISRRVTIKATDVMAMLLPRIDTPSDTLLQSYPEPPVLRNSSNRGSLSATRSDSITWIATAPGASVIPGARVHWWNTETGELTTLTTDPLSILISGEAPVAAPSQQDRIQRALAFTLLLLSGLVLWRLLRWGLLRRLAVLWQRIGHHIGRLWVALTGRVLPRQLNPGGSPGRSGR
ncbi:MAG: hypothetical protein L7T24_02735 [Luminiphilus sp.]|nr:hypothetical protein [Luminiphilus sp.]